MSYNSKAMSVLIVTAANEAFAPLLRGLVKSLFQWEQRLFTDFACLDLGLSADTYQWLKPYAKHIVVPGWDLPVSESVRHAYPEGRASTARPFLPRYFPGYDIYMWLDADTWVQERFALEWLLGVAAQNQLAIVPELDRAYSYSPTVIEWRLQRMKQYYGPEAAFRAAWDTYYNSGVFALQAEAPHWMLWAKWLGIGLETRLDLSFCDQTALNQALWIEHLPVYPLPARCNWLCHLAMPLFHPEKHHFIEPLTPFEPIGILHLAGNMKDFQFDGVHEGRDYHASLMFPDRDEV